VGTDASSIHSLFFLFLFRIYIFRSSFFIYTVNVYNCTYTPKLKMNSRVDLPCICTRLTHCNSIVRTAAAVFRLDVT
jgi:hypothetical protein